MLIIFLPILAALGSGALKGGALLGRGALAAEGGIGKELGSLPGLASRAGGGMESAGSSLWSSGPGRIGDFLHPTSGYESAHPGSPVGKVATAQMRSMRARELRDFGAHMLSAGGDAMQTRGEQGGGGSGDGGGGMSGGSMYAAEPAMTSGSDYSEPALSPYLHGGYAAGPSVTYPYTFGPLAPDDEERRYR